MIANKLLSPSDLNNYFDKIFFDVWNKPEAVPTITKPFLPYNIYKDEEDNAVFELSVAGYDKEDISVELEDNILHVSGVHTEKEEDKLDYIYKGIATRNFNFKLPFNSSYEVKNTSLKNGILKIHFSRLKPRTKKLEITYK